MPYRGRGNTVRTTRPATRPQHQTMPIRGDRGRRFRVSTPTVSGTVGYMRAMTPATPQTIGELYNPMATPAAYAPENMTIVYDPVTNTYRTAPETTQSAFANWTNRHRNPNVGYPQQSMSYNPPSTTTGGNNKVVGGGTVRQHGYKQHIINKQYGNALPPIQNEAAGTTEPVGPAYPETGGDYYGYGGYGGGGGSYTPYNNTFTRYRGGYAAQPQQTYQEYNNSFNRARAGYAAPATAQQPTAMRVGVGATAPSPYRGYADQNQAQRWMQLLTNWRIG